LKLREIGDLANFIAAVGVIISLLFVAYEVKQNTEASLAANRHTVIAALREQLLVRAQSPSLSTVIEAAASGKELTPAQHSQYIAYLFAVMKSVEEAYFQYIEGGLDKEYLDTRVAGLMNRYFLGNELGRAFFEENKNRGEMTAAFAQAIDAKFSEMNNE
jgi:hypothetical protein